MSPFTPLTEFYLNTKRISEPRLPSFRDEFLEGFAEGMELSNVIWEALTRKSSFNPQLRKLLFILYKHFFDVSIPKVFGKKPSVYSIAQLDFKGTPLSYYPAMVSFLFLLYV